MNERYNIKPIDPDGQIEVKYGDVITVKGDCRVDIPMGGVIENIHVDGSLTISNCYKKLVFGDDIQVSDYLCIYDCTDVYLECSFEGINSLSICSSIIASLPCRTMVMNGSVFIYRTKFFWCMLPSTIELGKSLTIRECSFDYPCTNFKRINVGYDMTFSYCPDVSLPNDLFVGRDLSVTNTKSVTFSPSMIVLRNMNASHCLIENELGKDCFIGGFIDVRGSYALRSNININCFISRCVICSMDDINIGSDCHIERVDKIPFAYRVLYPTYPNDEVNTVTLKDGRIVKSIFNNSNRHIDDVDFTFSGVQFSVGPFVEIID